MPLRGREINSTPWVQRKALNLDDLLFTPRCAYAKFTVPQFDRFMRRCLNLDALPPD